MELEINKELVVSTCHIRPETNNYLGKSVSPESDGLLVVYETDCGWRVLCGIDDLKLFRETVNKLWVNGFGDLARLMDIAQDNYCKWLCLDADGPVVKELPEFEW